MVHKNRDRSPANAIVSETKAMIIAMTRKVLEGIPVNDETLAVDLINSVGARGHFLAEEHTYHNMRKLSEPQLIDRRMRQFWQEKGSQDLGKACDQRARELLESHKPDPLPPGVHSALQKIIRNREEELKITPSVPEQS